MSAPSRAFGALSVAVALGVALVATSQAADGATALPATTIHGLNFEIKTQADLNFCIEADPGSAEGRTLTVQGCSGFETQRWAFPWYSSGVNQLVDSQGMCLNVRGLKVDNGEYAVVEGCRADRAEFLTYTSAGLLMSAKGCLVIVTAAANAHVLLATCDATKATQRWVVSHPST
jgi:hypothetical protein